MKINKKIIQIIIVVIILIMLLILLVIKNDNKLTCTLDKELIDGFSIKEIVEIKINNNKVQNIKLDKTISMDEYYKKYGTYKDTLEKLFDNGYSYVNGMISSTDTEVNVKVNTNEKGIVLDNVTIKNNAKDEKTSLRFNILNDIEKDKNAIKVGDKYKKNELKKKITKLGYECK